MISEIRRDPEARGELLEAQREYLWQIARRSLAKRTQVRMGASDIVQETMAQAEAHLEQFRGTTVEEFRAWLVQIHQRQLIGQAARHGAGKRDVRRERAFAAGQDSQANGIGEPAASGPTPSVLAIRGERLGRLERLMDELPEAQRRAVSWRYLDGWSVSQIALALGKSEAAAGGLIKRGLESLREAMQREKINRSC